MKHTDRTLLLLLWMLGATAGASAATLVITSAGYWQLTVDANGTPVLKEFDDIVRMGEEPNPEPNPDPDPDPNPNPDPVTLTGKVRKWAGEVNEPGVAEAQGLIMEFVAEQAERGTFRSKSRMTEFTKEAIPKTLEVAGSTKTDQWMAVWDDKVWPEVRRIEAAGQMNTLADQARVWREIAVGFKATTNAQWTVEFSAQANLEIKGEANPFLERLLQVLFQMLLDWLINNPFNPGGLET